jgi:hypothetical protein
VCVPTSGRSDRPRIGESVAAMTDVIAAVLGTVGWVGGLLILILMAVLPLLERLGDRR